VRMDDVLGTGWRLIARDGAPAIEPVWPHLRATSLPELHEADGVLAAWFERHRCTAALVRPDQYVFGTATDAVGMAGLITQARAALH